MLQTQAAMTRLFLLGSTLLGLSSFACGSSPPHLDTPQTLPPADPQADVSRHPNESGGAAEPKEPKPESKP